MAKEKQTSKSVPLGTPGRPYPAMLPATTEKGYNGESISIPPRLGVLEDPIMIPTDKDYKEVMGIAYRDMPTPSMLPAFTSALEKRSPDSPRKLQFVIGPPGTGKSYLAKLTSRLQSKQGPIVADCGERDLQELLFETILDKSGKDLFTKIENKLAKNELNPVSINILRDGLGKGFSEEETENGKRYAVDWNSVGKETDQIKPHKKALDALNEVAKLEGLEADGGGISLTTQEGPLIRAWKEGRGVVLDEYNKGKPGSDSGLQVLWQVFNGENKEHTVEGGAGQSFTFKRSEMPEKFFITLTGNEAIDGEGTHELSESAYSRLRPEYIPAPNEEDWQHRICQMLTDVPVSTLHNSSEKQWRDNPEKFGKFVKTIQTLGRTEEQIKNIPDYKKDMADNWKGVLEASKQLSKFYTEWAKYIDPDQTNSGLMMEVDEEYRDQVGVGMRMMISHLNQAVMQSNGPVSVEESKGFDVDQDWELEPAAIKKDPDAREKKSFGDKLSEIILADIDSSTRARGKPNLHKVVMQLAADTGIIEPELQEGAKNTHMKTIGELLDTRPKEIEITEKTIEAQKILCDHLRKKDPELSSNNDDIVSALEVQTSLDSLKEEKEMKEGGPRDRFLAVPNPDFLETTSSEAVPFVLVPVIEGLPTPEEANSNKKAKNPEVAKLLDHDAFLSSLATPDTMEGNLDSLWNQAITELTSIAPEDDVSFAMAQKTRTEDNDGYGVTSIVCKKEGSDKPMKMNVVMHQGSPNRVLIAGDGEASKEVSEQLAKAGIDYVDINQKDALQQINKGISKVIGLEGEDKERIQTDLLDAFKFRNKTLQGEAKEDLGKALKTKEKATGPVYLMARQNKSR